MGIEGLALNLELEFLWACISHGFSLDWDLRRTLYNGLLVCYDMTISPLFFSFLVLILSLSFFHHCSRPHLSPFNSLPSLYDS